MFKGKTSTGASVTSTFGFSEAAVGKTWILVANRSGAKFFETKSPTAPLEAPTEELVCEDGRRSQPGRGFSNVGHSYQSFGTGNAGRDSALSRHEVAARKFAKTLSAKLEKAGSAHKYEKLVVVAEPRFLGILRKALSPRVRERITVTLEKDIEEMPNHALTEHLSALLAVK